MKRSVTTIRHCIPRISLQGMLALLVVALGNAAALAADTTLPDVAAYRLRIEHDTVFRLVTSNPGAPVIEAQQEPAIPARFAGRRFVRLIDEAARKEALDPALVHAVIAVESAYDPMARSAMGAIGLMQVMPGTAAQHGVSDPGGSLEANLRAGTRYLSHLMKLFHNRIDLVLAAYNAGENAVLRYGLRIPPFRETQRYVPAVLARYREWREPEPPSQPVHVRIQYMPGTRLQVSAVDAAVHHPVDASRPGWHQPDF